MHSYYLLQALDIAQERAAEADRNRLAAQGRRTAHGPNALRRLVARAAVAVARVADESTVGHPAAC
ncbi:MAG TPA: hypothetical protein VH440_10910 [Candidatus Limnocylindrales bacterium]|jgi:hypothetical protein